MHLKALILFHIGFGFALEFTRVGAPTHCFAVFNCTPGLSSAFFEFYEISLGFCALQFFEGSLF